MDFLKVKLKACLEAIHEDNLGTLSQELIQYCIYPRLMFSAQDAMYSLHFLKTLHILRVPNFNMIQTLAQILKNVVPSIHCCTTAESDNLGIFFLELFTMINEWAKPEVWERECEGYSGFSKMIGTSQSIKLGEFQSISETIHKRFAQNLTVCF